MNELDVLLRAWADAKDISTSEARAIRTAILEPSPTVLDAAWWRARMQAGTSPSRQTFRLPKELFACYSS